MRLVHLTGPRELLSERITRRRDHFMPPGLLDSQLATLEPPGEDEGIAVSIEPGVDAIADGIVRRLMR